MGELNSRGLGPGPQVSSGLRTYTKFARAFLHNKKKKYNVIYGISGSDFDGLSY